jgi:hypothetical protein
MSITNSARYRAFEASYPDCATGIAAHGFAPRALPKHCHRTSLIVSFDPEQTLPIDAIGRVQAVPVNP